jgi:hypothetical protein
MMQINWKEIRHRMVELGIRSDAQLARGAEIHPNTIGSTGSFRSDTVDRIAKYLNCHPFEIILVDDTPAPAPTASAPTREQQRRALKPPADEQAEPIDRVSWSAESKRRAALLDQAAAHHEPAHQPPAAKSLEAALERQKLGIVLTVEERTLIRNARAMGQV